MVVLWFFQTDVDRSDWQNVLGALPYLKAMK
jgi:hypothetical protein